MDGPLAGGPPVKSSNSILSLIAIGSLLAVISCGSDDPAGDGNDDTTPPSVSAVAPVDQNHVNITFSEAVTERSAETRENYTLVEAATPFSAAHPLAAAPGDTLYDLFPVLQADKHTVMIYTLFSMAGTNFNLGVDGVSDVHGNAMTASATKSFAGSSDPDVTPPQIIARAPESGATNVPIGTRVTIHFSEPAGFMGAAPTWTSPGGPVAYTMYYVNYTTRALVPDHLLEKNALQTITISDVQDGADNVMPDVQWSFKTAAVTESIPPTLVSSLPANLATNVSTSSTIKLTFSEPMNRDRFGTQIRPFGNGFGFHDWSDDGKSVSVYTGFLVDNQQYLFTVTHAEDLSGNLLGVVSVVFTTGPKLETGGIAGVVAGDPGSAAADPTGAVVLAEGDSLAAIGSVAGNNSYSLTHVGDDTYEVLAILDTDHDGEYNFYYGDALGAYGFNISNPDYADSVIISNGTHANGINFPIYDLSAITGTATYDGAADPYWEIYTGLFTINDFDPDNPSPIAVSNTYDYDNKWYFNSLADGFPDGDYYVGAFLDIDDDGYVPGYDPVGFYGGAESPTAVHVANGSDVHRIVIPVSDPVVVRVGAHRAPWNVTKRNPNVMRLMQRATEVQQRAQTRVSAQK